MTEIPEDIKLIVNVMGAMHNSTLDATDTVMRNLTIDGRQHEARFNLIRDAITDAMNSEVMLHPNVVIERCFAAQSPQNVERWLQENYGPEWRDYTTARIRGADWW